MKDTVVLRDQLKTKKGLSKGFTLIELLVVIAIIAILAAIAIPQYIQYMNTAASGAALADARQCLDELMAQNTAASALGQNFTIDPGLKNICSTSPSNTACTCTVTKGGATATGICSSDANGVGCTTS